MSATDSTTAPAAQPDNARRLMRQLAGYLPVNIAQVIASFGAIYLFTRLLGPESYGRYALILSALNFLYLFGFTWIEASAHRFYAPMAAQGRTADFIATLRWLAVISAPTIGIGAGIAIAASPLDPTTRLAAGVAAVLLMVRGVVRLGMETHRAAQRVIAFSMMEAMQILLGFAIGATLASMTSLKEAAPFIGLLIAAMLVFCIDWPKQSKDAKGGKVDHDAAKVYTAFGWSIVMIVMLEQLLAVADRFLIAGFLGEAKAGAFAAAFGLAPRILDILFVWTGRTAAPLNTSVYETEGPAAAQALARRYFATLIALTLPAAVGISLVAQPLAEIMVEEHMADQVRELIPWLTVSGFLAGFVTYYFGESYRLGRKMTLCCILLACGGVTNIALNIYLTPRLGLQGAAIASVSGFVVAAILLALFTKRALHFPIPFSDVLKTGAAVAIMAAGITPLPDWGGITELALKSAVGGIIYAAMAVAFNISGARSLAARFAPGLAGRTLRKAVGPASDGGNTSDGRS